MPLRCCIIYSERSHLIKVDRNDECSTLKVLRHRACRRALRCATNICLSAAFALTGIFVCDIAPLKAAELTFDQFRKMVTTDIGKTHMKVDSIGTPIRVFDFGENNRDFLLVPVFRQGKLSGVFKDDDKRNWVSLIASEAVLKSTRSDLFSKDGAKKIFQERGLGSGDPVPISIGPFSIFGVLGAGWYLPTQDSYVLLSFEGKLISEPEVDKLFPTRAPSLRHVRERLKPTE